MWLTQLSSIFQ